MKYILFNLCVLILAITIGIAPAAATGVYDIPNPDASTWVIDQAEAISRTNENQLSDKLKNLAANSDNQIRVVLVRRLNYGETIESLTEDLFNSWYPTPEDQANQTLLVLDTLTNNVSMRRGEEVKTILDQETVDSILEENIRKQLKKDNKYNQAVLSASDRLIAILSGEPDPGPPQELQTEINIEGNFSVPEETEESNATLWVIGLLVLATVIPMATYFFYAGFSN